MENNHISIWGRTLEEYQKMFSIDNILQSTKILSIADGPSTFNLQLRNLGIQITSVDPIYDLSADNLKQAFKKSYSFNKQFFLEYPEKFNLNGIEEIEKVLTKRQSTFDTFIQDYEKNKINYKFGKLPKLEFASNSFDLCFCSNFLFLFDHLFDLTFHLNSITELLRTSREVRIFPLYNNIGQESKYLNSVTQYLTDNNYSWTIESNDYHIYRDGNKFLKIITLTE